MAILLLTWIIRGQTGENVNNLPFVASIPPDSVHISRPSIPTIQRPCQRIKIRPRNVRMACTLSNCRELLSPLRAQKTNAHGFIVYGHRCSMSPSKHMQTARNSWPIIGMNNHQTRTNCAGYHSKLPRRPIRKHLCKVYIPYAVLVIHAAAMDSPFTCIYAMLRWMTRHSITAMAIFSLVRSLIHWLSVLFWCNLLVFSAAERDSGHHHGIWKNAGATQWNLRHSARNEILGECEWTVTVSYDLWIMILMFGHVAK